MTTSTTAGRCWLCGREHEPGACELAGRAGRHPFPREDGVPHATRVVATAHCRYCGVPIPVRAEGRAREFCRPSHRGSFHRRGAAAAVPS